jgi:hypothetical protein
MQARQAFYALRKAICDYNLFVTIPKRRLPRARLLSRPILISLVVLVGLLLSLFLLRRKGSEPVVVDTLRVHSQGLVLNGKEISVQELWEEYSKISTPRRVDVLFDPDISWGETWSIRDTLKRLAELKGNLTVTGIEEEF